MKASRTKLESFLFWWLIVNWLLSIVIMLLIAVLPARLAGFEAQGPMPPALIIAALVFTLWFYFIWRLRAPTPSVLLFGAILLFLSIVRIEWSDGLFLNTYPGPTFHFALVDNPSLLVQLNVLAVPIFVLCLVARYRRVLSAQTPSAVPND
jgi:hypothetical protein